MSFRRFLASARAEPVRHSFDNICSRVKMFAGKGECRSQSLLRFIMVDMQNIFKWLFGNMHFTRSITIWSDAVR